MAYKNDAPRIVQAMKGLSSAPKVTRGWPTSFAALPTIAVSEAGNVPVEFRDDAEYVAELVYDIRIFAYDAEEIDELAAQADEAMTGLRYQRSLTYDDNGAETRMKVMRYTRYA